MGHLHHFDISDLQKRYDLQHFVETGTSLGSSLAHAAGAPFVSLMSCDIDSVFAVAAERRFVEDKRIHIVCSDSKDFLEFVCHFISAHQPILFWLDAHFPGSDFGLKPYGDKPSDAIRLPLEDELTLIAERRLLSKDVILIDDLRIYKDGPFKGGKMPTEFYPACPPQRNIDFIYKNFSYTHIIEEHDADEGYVMMTPRSMD